MGTFQGGATLIGFWEQVVHAEIGLESFIDNDAPRLTIEAGDSKKVGYMKKHQHFEFYSHPMRRLNRIDSAKNWSDILTKPLDHILHWRGVTALGLSPPSQGPV